MANAYRLQEYQHGSLKEFFDQDAYCIPVEELVAKVESKDYRFFLEYKNFYKMVDTLEKYQTESVDVATREGREFVVFKRQLYQLYEIQNRSAAEHNAFSFEIERENLKWLYKASQEFQQEIAR